MNPGASEMLKHCRLCGRACGTDRTKRAGRCGGTDEVMAARAALHMWEEPCISGEEGSGTVFFSGCPLRCVFCQNRDIALGKAGYPVTVPRLAEIFLALQAQHANNINLVTPTHFVPQIIEAVEMARGGLARSSSGAAGGGAHGALGRLHIPIVYNTGSYETRETIRLLAGTVDIFLPDLKFHDPAVAERYAGAPDYFDIASEAIDEMVKTAGPPVFDGRGILQRGVIVRHMVLPGHTADSMRIVDYLHEAYGGAIYISLMNQYTPMPGVERDFPELGRRVTRREYGRVVDHAIGIGVEQAFIQEGGAAEESFIPAFDGEGILR